MVSLPTPTPKPGHVLIRIHASTLSSADRRIRALDMPGPSRLLARAAFGWRSPRRVVLGTELAGEIAAIGRGVTRFSVGDPVFAFPGTGLGCHAEYRAMPETGCLARIPKGLDMREAAALSFGGTTALDFLRRALPRPGERLLVRGASGSVGSAAVQLARHLGLEVTALCGGDNAGWVGALGAMHIIDYRREDVFSSPQSYDMILDAVGGISFSRWRTLLRPGGRLLLVAGGLRDMALQPWVGTGDKRLIAGMARERVEDLLHLASLASAGKYRPHIDRVFPLAAIQEAHVYADSGHKRGNVVIDLLP